MGWSYTMVRFSRNFKLLAICLATFLPIRIPNKQIRADILIFDCHEAPSISVTHFSAVACARPKP